ncbi:MAG: hypothetical protein F4012_03635 [Gemmatimonadales bacterium]|nr:hypothetical protein [Gemmatimonadales bacterium]MYL05922.1 hypothetical protein [Gemmatimonadales bacterium]
MPEGAVATPPVRDVTLALTRRSGDSRGGSCARSRRRRRRWRGGGGRGRSARRTPGRRRGR